MEETIDWAAIRAAFAEPFNPSDVDFRVQGKANEQTGKAQVVAYVDARTIQDRLDAVVGPGAWSFDYTPLAVDAKGVVLSAKGVLTIYGVGKADIGDASNFEASKGTVSDALKRAAVQWGIGRYLYAIPSAWVPADKNGKIEPNVLRELRARLPRPKQADNAPVIEAAATHTEARQQAPQTTQAAAKPASLATPATRRSTDTDQHQAPVKSWGTLHRRALALGYDTQDAWERLVTSVTKKTTGWTVGDLKALDKHLAEQEAIEAQATEAEQEAAV